MRRMSFSEVAWGRAITFRTQRPEPAPVEDLMGASHDLHVRLRHPLLPQPHGFDGLARQGASHGGVVGLLNENWPRRNPVRL